MCLQATAEFGNTFAQRPILMKQRALCFYRPSAYALGQIIADIPWKVIFVLYNLPIYWLVNLRREAGPFFIWFLTLYVSFISMGVVFRTIAVFTTILTHGRKIVDTIQAIFTIRFFIAPLYSFLCLTVVCYRRRVLGAFIWLGRGHGSRGYGGCE